MVTTPKLRVLIVDDNHDSADSLSLVVQGWGYDTQVVYDGKSALRVSTRHIPDVVLIDLAMPGMSGDTLAVHMRQEEATRRATLVAVTGYTDEVRRQLATASGFDHFLPKPLDLNNLSKVLQSLVPLRPPS